MKFGNVLSTPRRSYRWQLDMAPGFDSVGSGDLKALKPALALVVAVVANGVMGMMMMVTMLGGGRAFTVLDIAQSVLNVYLWRTLKHV